MNIAPNGELVPIGGGDPIPLIRETMTIGRRESCDIPIRLPNVSGLHCELSFRDGFWWIRDLGSTNGIKVNSVRVDKKLVQPGDMITIAKRNFKLDYTLPSGRSAVDELAEDDILSRPLLEKAGLVRPQREDKTRHSGKPDPRHVPFDPSRFLLEEEEDE
jgi:pSer/pThr/pTyr-binding forkhead associated (FHA) protein